MSELGPTVLELQSFLISDSSNFNFFSLLEYTQEVDLISTDNFLRDSSGLKTVSRADAVWNCVYCALQAKYSVLITWLVSQYYIDKGCMIRLKLRSPNQKLLQFGPQCIQCTAECILPSLTILGSVQRNSSGF